MSIFRRRRTLKPVAMDPERGIPREVLEEILGDAHWAPTHGLTQPWRFHIFATPPARASLAEALVDIYDRTTPPEKRDEAKRAKLSGGPRRAAAVVALLARIDPAGTLPEWEEIAAVSCAAQNLMLSAHQAGIGSFWATPPAACSAAFVQWLGADTSHRAMGMIMLGWPIDGQAPPRSVRHELSRHATWHEAESET